MTNQTEASDGKGVSRLEIADKLDIDEYTVNALARKRIVIRLGHGRYDLDASLRNYIRRLREMASGRTTTEESGLNLPDESAKLKKAQRQNYELKNSLIEHSAVLLEHVRPAWGRIISAVRNAMLAVPGKLRLLLPHLSPQDIEVISKAIKDGLKSAALTDTPPAIDIPTTLEDEE